MHETSRIRREKIKTMSKSERCMWAKAVSTLSHRISRIYRQSGLGKVTGPSQIDMDIGKTLVYQ